MKLIHFVNNSLCHSTKSASRNSAIKLSLFSLLLCLSVNSQASNQLQSLSDIRLAAKIFLEEKQASADNPNTDTVIEINIGTIDPRLRLVKCDQPIEAFFPQKMRTKGRTTVGVRCPGKVAWKIFISVNILEYQNVWVAQRNISTREIISANDVSLQKRVITSMRKLPIDDLELIINTSPRRTIRSGSVIFEDSICLVCKGDKVKVIAQNNLISIYVDAVALSDASLGETTQLRNTRSKRIFGAVVTGKSQLTVQLSTIN